MNVLALEKKIILKKKLQQQAKVQNAKSKKAAIN